MTVGAQKYFKTTGTGTNGAQYFCRTFTATAAPSIGAPSMIGSPSQVIDPTKLIAGVKLSPKTACDGYMKINLDLATGVVDYTYQTNIKSERNTAFRVTLDLYDGNGNYAKSVTLKSSDPAVSLATLTGLTWQPASSAIPTGYHGPGTYMRENHNAGDPPGVTITHPSGKLNILIDDDSGQKPGFVLFNNFDFGIKP